MTNEPPPPAERLVRWSLPPWERHAVLGDLQEEFTNLTEASGSRAARRWYWTQSLKSLWPNVRRRYEGDERRQAMARQGLASIGLAALWLVIGQAQPDDAHPEIMAAGSFATGLTVMLRSLFKKRVSPTDTAKANAVGVAILVALVLVAVGLAYYPPARRAYENAPWSFVLGTWLPIVLAISVGVRLWPWWPADSPASEVVVERRHDLGDLTQPAVTVVVPNMPMGMSGLILFRTRNTGAGDVAFLGDDPIIDRTFRGGEGVRVCAVVNTPNGRAAATAEVVGASGRIVRRVTAPVVAGLLQERIGSWDDVADADPPDHFGYVDVTVPLLDLPPDDYRLTLTVSDGVVTSRQDELITVASSGQPARRDDDLPS